MEKLLGAKIKLHSVTACDGHLFIRGLYLYVPSHQTTGGWCRLTTLSVPPSGLHGERDLIRAEMLTH